MINKNLSRYIDFAFCLILLPAMIMLLPIEKWLVNNSLFVSLLVVWLYIIYAVHRLFTVPLFFQHKKHKFWAFAILFTTIGATYMFTQYQLEHPRFFDQIPSSHAINLSKKMQTQQQAVWFLYVLVTTFSIVVGLLTELSRQIIVSQEIEFEKNKAELALYKAQINPHFLFNTLNTLYGLVITKSERAEAAFVQFIHLMKYMYSNGTKDKVALETEVEYIRQYIELQKHRLNEHTKIFFSFQDHNESRHVEIAPMLLITFVENALKYGVSSHKDSNIYIAISVEDNELRFTTQNNIISPTSKEKSAGIGISNCRKRLDLIYPKKYTLDISERNNQYLVTLILMTDAMHSN